MTVHSESKTVGRSNKEILSLRQRSAEVVSMIVILLILAFFVYQDTAHTGFFTAKFGVWEMFAFYGSFLLSLLPPFARSIIGRRNPVRLPEAFFNIFSTLALLYLLAIFPFNFAHFADALPEAIRFMFWWLSSDIAKIFIALGILGSIISAVVNLVKFFTFDPRLNM